MNWSIFKYFTEKENWGDANKINGVLIAELDRLREFIGVPVIIHCGTQGEHVKNSMHYQGMAIDCHAEGISLLEFFIASCRFNFTGIGIYPQWNNKGLHLDIRIVNKRAIWGKLDNEYVKVDDKFIKECL